MQGSHLADDIMRCHNASLHTAVHDLELEAVGYPPGYVYQEKLAMQHQTSVQESRYHQHFLGNIVYTFSYRMSNVFLCRSTCQPSTKESNLRWAGSACCHCIRAPSSSTALDNIFGMCASCCFGLSVGVRS